MFRVWRLNPLWAVPLFVVLLILDLGLFAASATKFADGGWLPVSIAAVLVMIFATWRRGRTILRTKLAQEAMPIDVFLKSVSKVTRVPATAIYLTSTREGIPPALIHNLKYNLILHERVILLTVETMLTPTVSEEHRLTAETLGDGFTRVLLRYGFAESPDVPEALAPWFAEHHCKPHTVAYFLSRQTLIATKGRGMPRLQEQLFVALVRNSETPMSFFKLPVNRVVELGSQVEI